MDPTAMAIELSAARWEQWLGATLRMQHGRYLLAAAAPCPPTRRPAPRRRDGGRLVWLLAASVAGFLLLRI